MEEPHLISHATIPQRLGRYILEWEWAVCTFLVLNSQSTKRCCLLSCRVAFCFCEEKDGFSTPHRQNKRRILQINCIKKCDRNIKCICGELAFQILKIAWFVAALPWQLELHLYGAHIENFEFSLFLR